MALKNTVVEMKKLMECLMEDIDKACNGNKAAAQRMRTCTIKFAKIAKVFRKESVAEGKKGGKKKPALQKKAAPKRKATAKVAKKKRK